MNSFLNINVTDIQEIITVHSKKGMRVKIENRKSYGLSFCEEGRIIYTHSGQDFICNKNCAVILPKGESYLLSIEETGDFPLINFQCEGLDLNTFLIIPLNKIENYLNDFENMKKLSVFNNNGLKIKSIFYDVLSRLFSENINLGGVLDPALSFIKKNYTDLGINNSDLAKLCNISEVYFRRLFFEKLGITPKQSILESRIKRAKQLLQNSKYSVTYIAENCGFSNVYHFCRAFKNVTGLTPSQFSNLAKKTVL